MREGAGWEGRSPAISQRGADGILRHTADALGVRAPHCAQNCAWENVLRIVLKNVVLRIVLGKMCSELCLRKLCSELCGGKLCLELCRGSTC